MPESQCHCVGHWKNSILILNTPRAHVALMMQNRSLLNEWVACQFMWLYVYSFWFVCNKSVWTLNGVEPKRKQCIIFYFFGLDGRNWTEGENTVGKITSIYRSGYSVLHLKYFRMMWLHLAAYIWPAWMLQEHHTATKISLEMHNISLTFTSQYENAPVYTFH